MTIPTTSPRDALPPASVSTPTSVASSEPIAAGIGKSWAIPMPTITPSRVEGEIGNAKAAVSVQSSAMMSPSARNERASARRKLRVRRNSVSCRSIDSSEPRARGKKPRRVRSKITVLLRYEMQIEAR